MDSLARRKQDMNKGNLKIDPRGLIFESYRMEGISLGECRSIFLDWALGLPASEDMPAALLALKVEYADKFPDHPMSGVIAQGLDKAPLNKGRLGCRAAKR